MRSSRVVCIALSLFFVCGVDLPQSVAQSTAPVTPGVYRIVEVPQQMFSSSAPLTFTLSEGDGAAFSVTASPQVSGTLKVERSGVFTFAPSANDAGNFSLTLTAKHPDGSVATKTVVVSVFGNLAPEYTLVAKASEAPPEDSRRYITVTETEDPEHRPFNHQKDRKLVNVVISGKTVVIDKNADANGIVARFDGRADIASFSVFAETLVVRSALHLPQTNVHLAARELRFEDGAQPAGTAAIVTTPLALETNPGLGNGGENGLNAGNLALDAGTLVVPPGDKPRFILTGGAGQEAGLGKDGAPGVDMACYNNVVLGDTCIVHIHQFAGPTSFGPDNTWPSDGQAATAPGAPGAGGGGGNLTANLTAIGKYVTADIGQPGKMAAPVKGGPAGNPVHAINAELHEKNGDGQAPGPCLPPQYGLLCHVGFGGGGGPKIYGIETEHYSHPGSDASAPPVPPAAVDKGILTTAGDADEWLKPILVRAVLHHAQDAYLNGDLDYTQSVLDAYLPLLAARLGRWESGAAERDQANSARLTQAAIVDRPALQAEIDRKDGEFSSLVQLRMEMAATATRLANNQDYFGHPAGWVPQLSLAATLRSYSNEIAADMPILYLAYYVQESSADRARHLAGLQQVESQLADDIKNSTSQLNDKQAELPALETEASALQGKLQLFQQSLATKELTLRARAEHNVDDAHSSPFWKTGLKVLSVAATVCPVGQPAVGAVGVGLGVLANAGDQSVVDTAQQLGSLSDSFSKTKIAESVDQYHKQIALLDPGKVKNLQTAQTYVKGLVPLAQGMAKEYQAVNGALQTHKAPASEVDKELAQLEASDPEFAQLSQDLMALNIEKEKFDGDVATILSDTSRLASEIQTDWTTVDVTNRAVSNAVGELDHEAVQEVAAYGRRTRDRLLLYQYYLAKAYEYRLLRPYPGDFHLDKLLDELVRLTSTAHDDSFQPLGPTDFANLSRIYTESVQEVVNDAWTQLQTQPPPQESPYTVTLSQVQLDALNRDGEMGLNLALAVPHFIRQDNRRLVSISVADGLAAPPTDGSAVQPIHIKFEHGGASTFRSGKASYKFQQGRSTRDIPFSWSGLLTGTQWSNDVISPEYLALLQQLLGTDHSEKEYKGLFAYPGLESTIAVTREGGDAQAISRLTLLVTYDFDPAEEPEYPIDVVGTEGVPALIEVSAPDNSGRSLGQGSFTRYYTRDTPVTLTAPERFGTHTFQQWEVPGQPPVLTPVLKLVTGKPQRAIVKYTP